MSAFDDPFGTILVGTWLASLLYGIAVSQAVQYFKAFPNDSLARKGLVYASLFFCLVALVGDYADVYLPTVTFWGNFEAIQTQYWPSPLYVTANSFVGTIVNSFLIFRFYSLSKNLWMTLILGLLTLLALAGALLVAIMLTIFSHYSERSRGTTPTLIWIIASAAADVSIATALIWKLQGMKTTFKETNTMIHRIMLRAIQSGATTSVATLLIIITYLRKNDSNLPTLFCFLLGPLYVLTLLYNFNLRQQHNHAGNSGTIITSETRGNNIIMDGIQVHRTAVVTMDPTESEQAHRRAEEEGSMHMKQDPDVEAFSGQKIRVTHY
ncbi:hypothetical protein C8R43DRAFT_1050693 [Mycena crocata]|nr:hypothetical protein C8R43DRAFT_1050693 [Mycena crocata]